MYLYASPLLPHEIDALPNAAQIRATLNQIRDEEFHSFDEEAERLEGCISGLKADLESIKALIEASPYLNAANRQSILDTAARAIRQAGFVLED